MPDGSLHEDFVFVERDQLAQCFGRQTLSEDGVGWPVALEGAVRNLERGYAVRRDLLGCLAKGQGLGLREEVRHQQIVMGPKRIERLAEADEIAGDQPGW